MDKQPKSEAPEPLAIRDWPATCQPGIGVAIRTEHEGWLRLLCDLYPPVEQRGQAKVIKAGTLVHLPGFAEFTGVPLSAITAMDWRGQRVFVFGYRQVIMQARDQAELPSPILQTWPRVHFAEGTGEDITFPDPSDDDPDFHVKDDPAPPKGPKAKAKAPKVTPPAPEEPPA